MAQTANYNLEKPDTTKNVDEEFYQLQETLDLLDSILAALQTAVNGKSAVGHTHAISDVINLASELAAKMPASTTFKLDDLTDVSGADGAPNNYILVKSALGWLPSSALAALGTHGHLISEITGLVSALADKADAAATYTKTEVDTALALKASALQPFVDVASATTTDIGAAASQNVRITGAANITSLGTAAVGTVRHCVAMSTLTLTQNATSLILPTGSNIIATAGDSFTAVSLGSGNWRVPEYNSVLPIQSQFAHFRDSKASGTAGGTSVVGIETRVMNATVTNTITGASLNTGTNVITLPAGTYDIEAHAPTFSTGRSRLLITTDTGTILLNGPSLSAPTGTASVIVVKGRRTFASATGIVVRQFSQTAVATNGYGIESSQAGQDEVYAEFFARKVS